MPHRYTIRQLVQVRDWYRAHPNGRVTIREIWPPETFTAAEWHAWFRRCLDRKINAALPAHEGRKHDPQWQTEMSRAARALNTPRLAIHWLPPDLRSRFTHRLMSQERP